jgi:threonine dehydrogenase-like Zn-dependent dehydrogenase
MRALTVLPGVVGSAELSGVREPDVGDGSVLVATRSVGICGTDHELLAGEHGRAPAGESRLVLGHESLGEVLEAPPDSGLRAGDGVVGIVRRPIRSLA